MTFYSARAERLIVRSITSKMDAHIWLFVQKQPWRHVIGLQERYQLRQIKSTEQISADLDHITFDCVNNLRSAPHQLGFAMAVKYTANPNPKACKFPYSTAALLANHVKAACKDLPPEIRTLFASFQSCKGGNIPFTESNRPKHKILVPVEIGRPQLTRYAKEIPKGVRGARCSERDARPRVRRVRGRSAGS